jgi:hypothetical protein
VYYKNFQKILNFRVDLRLLIFLPYEFEENENEEDIESYLDFKHNISVTRKLKLSEDDVLNVVLEWYTNGLCTDVFQDEDGTDLEEYIESKLNQ